MRSSVGIVAIVGFFGSAASAQDLTVTADAQAQAVSPGGMKVTAFAGFSTEEDGHTDWSVPLDPSQCYLFSGAGGTGVKHLFLYLWNPGGKRVADAKPDAPMVTMTHCPEMPGMFHLQAKTGEGHGPFAVSIWSKPAPPKAPPLELGAVCDQQAAASAPGATRTAPHFQSFNDKMDWALSLEPGTCYWFVGCGHPASVKKLYLYLWGPNGKRITDSRPSNPNPIIGHCALQPGMYKLQGKIDSGKGEFRVGVYAKRSQ